MNKDSKLVAEYELDNWFKSVLNFKLIFFVYVFSVECGIPSSVEVPDKDGNTINITYYPWNAIIYRKQDGEYVPYCSGTLITPFSVVTGKNMIRNFGRILNLYYNKIHFPFQYQLFP